MFVASMLISVTLTLKPVGDQKMLCGEEKLTALNLNNVEDKKKDHSSVYLFTIVEESLALAPGLPSSPETGCVGTRKY